MPETTTAEGERKAMTRPEMIELLNDALSAEYNSFIGHALASNPYVAAERGWIDEVIQPRDTRPKLIRALKMLDNKVDHTPRKKHGNIPL